MEQELSTVTMSSADWQRNEQRHEIRERRLRKVIIVLAIALLITAFIKTEHIVSDQNNNVTEKVGETYER